MRASRPGWQDPVLSPPAADEPAPLPRSALLPLAAGLLITAILAIVHPAGWLVGLETGTVITMPMSAALTLMFGDWNLFGPARRRWSWAARRQRRQRARRPADLTIVVAKGRITEISGEPAAVAGGEVIPARPGSPPLPPPGVYYLRWQDGVQPQLLSARRVRPDSRWLALIGAVLFGAGTACMLALFRHVFPLQDGGRFALAFYFLLMTAGLAIPAWLLAAEWRYLTRHPNNQLGRRSEAVEVVDLNIG
jgi:hypothetical protein